MQTKPAARPLIGPLGIIIAIAFAVYLGSRALAGGSALPTSAAHPSPYTRAELRSTQFTTSDSLIHAFGKPESTQAIGADGTQYWYYHNIDVDPTTGKTDAQVQFVISISGGIAGVNFY